MVFVAGGRRGRYAVQATLVESDSLGIDFRILLNMDAAPQVEEARRRFARSLVGRWSTEQGTFDMVMGQQWEIRPDGTGKFSDTRAFRGTIGETPFEWRQSEPFAFELRLGDYVSFEPAEETELDEADSDDGEPWPWLTIRYDFTPVKTEFGLSVGLIDVAQLGTKCGGFLMSLAPLAYRGSIEESA
jgi:hypothetical protein